MIAKRILRPKATSDFGRLGAYILKEERGAGGARADQTFEYILGRGDGAGRVRAARATNCLMDSPDLAIKEILATQALNKRSRGDRTYHLVVSFEPGETPEPAQLDDIETGLCVAIGLGGHQRISALHIDRAHLHLHIAINKVAPDSFRCIEPYFDKRKLMAACAALELKHGLATTNHGLSKRAAPKGRPGDLEAHAAEASFVSWVKERIEAPLLAALNGKPQWAGIHEILAREGLALKRRGAGLVIAGAHSGLAAKASSINRAFSLHELTSRLGPFQAGTASAPAPGLAYRRTPLQRANTAALYAAYVRQRKEGLEARRRASAGAASARSGIYDSFKDHQTEVQRSGLTPAGKRARRSELRLLRASELSALAAKQREAIAAISCAYFFTWVSFLQGHARAGETDALEALRASGAAGAKTAAAFLAAKDAAAAKTILLQDLNPLVRRNGEVLYKLTDGGAVTDERHRVRVDKVSYQAAFLALTLAAQRFPGQALALEGTGTFKKQAVEVAAALKPGIAFSDSALEAERRRLIVSQAAPAPPAPLVAFIAEQNNIAHGLSTGLTFRAWPAGDTGAVIYHGNRSLKDGSQALLFRKGAAMLVKLASEDEIRKASTWPLGSVLCLDRTGRITGRARQ
jgi:hypothetical protein